MAEKNKVKGDKGEELAVEYLTAKGYEILETQYRFSRGEIDIIAKDPSSGFIAFIEVKYKENLEFGHPAFSVTKNKQKQVRKVAELYLYEKNLTELECRFDVIAILNLMNEKPQLEHFENAF